MHSVSATDQISIPATSPSSPIKVSRKVLPAGMSYQEYAEVYRQLLAWIKTVRLTDTAHPAFLHERDLLDNHPKLQIYLKVCNGKLPAAQARLTQAIERIRRTAPFDANPGSLPTPADKLQGVPTNAMEPPPSSSIVTEPVSHTSNIQVEDSKPSDDGSDIEREQTSSQSSTPTLEDGDAQVSADSNTENPNESDEKDDAGVASLLMLRRLTKDQTTSMPTPLKQLLTRPVTSKSLKTPTLPSNSPYYRSANVLAASIRKDQLDSASSIRPSTASHDYRFTLSDSTTPQKRQVRMTPKSAGLPQALQGLRIQSSQSLTREAVARHNGYARQIHAPPSPCILVPAPPFSPTARRILPGHARSTSDIGAGGLRFIPPPPSPRRRYIPPLQTSHLSGQSMSGNHSFSGSLPTSHFDHLPLPSPFRTSFVRTFSPTSHSAGEANSLASSQRSSPGTAGSRFFISTGSLPSTERPKAPSLSPHRRSPAERQSLKRSRSEAASPPDDSLPSHLRRSFLAPKAQQSSAEPLFQKMKLTSTSTSPPGLTDGLRFIAPLPSFKSGSPSKSSALVTSQDDLANGSVGFVDATTAGIITDEWKSGDESTAAALDEVARTLGNLAKRLRSRLVK